MNEGQLVNIKARSKSGQVIDINVQEIIEIDGKPHQSAGDFHEMQLDVAHLSGRVTAIERIIAGSEENG